MASPPKPWKAEYAKSGRSSCRSCKSPIDKETLRLGKMVQSSQFDGFMPMWNHASCILKKANQIKSQDDVDGLDLLRWEDQENIRKYADGSEAPKSGGSRLQKPAASAATASGIEVSQNSRATCRHCNQKIMKGEVRISAKPEGQGSKGLTWNHANCYMESSPTIEVNKLSGWNDLPASDQTVVSAMVKKSTSKGPLNDPVDDTKPIQQSTSKGNAKRKSAISSDQKSKVAKSEGESLHKTPEKNADALGNDRPQASNLDRQLETQSKELWSLKDDLRKHVTASELREMLEINKQNSKGSELDLRDRCADGMLFGRLEKCPLCSGYLFYSGGMYKCSGFLSAWSKCSYSTTESVRVPGKWNIPEGSENEYLGKWFKSQKAKKPVRVLPPPTPGKPSGTPSTKDERLEDLKVAINGLPGQSMEEWRNKLEEVGGQIHEKVKKDTNCLVVGEMVNGQNAEVKKARRMKLPIVRENYLVDCLKRQKKLPFDLYKIEALGETSGSGVVTVKVKGRGAVHEASGLQDTGHILEVGKSIYNTTLNLSDLSTGVNSYYILQIIEEDKGSGCYVFRKWGRVGNEKIGGSKLDERSKEDAIEEFGRLFLEKTGNTWQAWERKVDFKKRPGKFFPLDIDYGVNKEMVQRNDFKDSDSKLARPLLELMKMLFNVETYRAAMMEFEINMSEMPLGKLSKSNIQQGFEALTEIQNLLSSSAYNPTVRDSLIVDASNRFFTMIPSVHPHVIRDEDDFKSKVKMLEALQDIEIASRLVGFDTDNSVPIDEKYKMLHCEMNPLPHNSEDYRLVEKYLQTTHAPTHSDWSLELEEVFSLEREGEFDKFAPYRDKLKNKMLLWHGSRLTNFVGILSQGLRIAPPEAPATGYMFGKGVYFADLVSKSAQYCYTDKKNPVGLMILSEVALGEVYELRGAKYMDKPPRGKHSTKGLGKQVPQETEYVRWRDDVVVPCGKPVPSNVKATELNYNEYIVYNTAQVKMQFLLKVRFHHKR